MTYNKMDYCISAKEASTYQVRNVLDKIRFFQMMC